jgi:hypothetical protein
MTWWRQVVHVLRRDVAASWWLYLGFLVAVAVRVRSAYTVTPVNGFDGWSLFVLLVTVAAIAMRLIMNDPPERAGALWGTLPISGSAVATGKLCVMLSMIAIAFTGEVVALARFAVTPSAAFSMSIGGVGALTGVVMLVATLRAITTSAWAVVALSLVLPMAALLLKDYVLRLFWPSSDPRFVTLPGWMVWVGFGISAFVLWRAYQQTFHRRLRIGMGVIGLSTLAIAWLTAVNRRVAMETPVSAIPSISGQRPFEIIQSVIEHDEESQSYVRVTVVASALSLIDRSRLSVDSAALRFPDGTVVLQREQSTVERSVRSLQSLRDPRPELRGVQRWIDRPASSVDTTRLRVAFALSTPQRRWLKSGEARLTVAASLEESPPTEVARFDARVPSQLSLSGRFIDVRPTGDAVAPGVRVRTMSVGQSDAGDDRAIVAAANTTPTSLVAVHRQTGEARFLRGSNGWGYQSSGLVLPATPLMRSNTVWAVAGRDELGPDAAWFANADVVFVEWKPARRFSMNASAPIAVGSESVVAQR